MFLNPTPNYHDNPKVIYFFDNYRLLQTKHLWLREKLYQRINIKNYMVPHDASYTYRGSIYKLIKEDIFNNIDIFKQIGLDLNAPGHKGRCHLLIAYELFISYIFERHYFGYRDIEKPYSYNQDLIDKMTKVIIYQYHSWQSSLSFKHVIDLDEDTKNAHYKKVNDSTMRALIFTGFRFRKILEKKGIVPVVS